MRPFAFTKGPSLGSFMFQYSDPFLVRINPLTCGLISLTLRVPFNFMTTSPHSTLSWSK